MRVRIPQGTHPKTSHTQPRHGDETSLRPAYKTTARLAKSPPPGSYRDRARDACHGRRLLDAVPRASTEGAEGEYLFQRTRLMRFVLANEGSVEDAAAQFRRMLQWRREANIAQIRANVKGRPWAAESVPGLDRLLGFMWRGRRVVMDLWGTTPTGDLLMVQCDGLTQFSGMSEVTDEELNESLYSMLELRQEHLDRMSEEQGRLVMVVQVRDLSGMAIMSLLSNARLIGQLQSVIKNGMDAYPECSKNTVLLNAPSSFEALMALVRPITSARAQARAQARWLNQTSRWPVALRPWGGPRACEFLGDFVPMLVLRSVAQRLPRARRPLGCCAWAQARTWAGRSQWTRGARTSGSLLQLSASASASSPTQRTAPPWRPRLMRM
ncbi:unnamed protein product [Prorocentrum cordatum]|uniref:CRAL-TRIO domain-containing protein n=1 Tax=Prorocentrum cordatum TaxID=2364126 RepID=A0ABN9T6C3_9DINO|nr:unnamed protein product [Polarella glacialis]